MQGGPVVLFWGPQPPTGLRDMEVKVPFLLSSSRSKQDLDWALNTLLMKPFLINKSYGAKLPLSSSRSSKKAGRTHSEQGQSQGTRATMWARSTLESMWSKELKCLMSSEDEEVFYIHAFYKTVDNEESHNKQQQPQGNRSLKQNYF